VVFLDRQFFALGQRVFFVCRRADSDVLGCGDGDVAFGVDLAGDGVDVTAWSRPTLVIEAVWVMSLLVCLLSSAKLLSAWLETVLT
jgi:hypothetical protein